MLRNSCYRAKFQSLLLIAEDGFSPLIIIQPPKFENGQNVTKIQNTPPKMNLDLHPWSQAQCTIQLSTFRITHLDLINIAMLNQMQRNFSELHRDKN